MKGLVLEGDLSQRKIKTITQHAPSHGDCDHNAAPSHHQPNNFIRNGAPVGKLDGNDSLVAEPDYELDTSIMTDGADWHL